MSEKLKIIFGLTLTLIIIIILVMYIFINKTKVENKKQLIKKMTIIGILSGLSVILYFIKFPLPIFVSFLEINFSNIPVLLASYMFGPIEGILVSIVRTIVKIPFSSTLCVGEIQDLIISIAISLITGLIYQKKKTKKRALIAMIFACITWVLIGVLSNAFVSISIYIEFMFDGNENILINIIGTLLPNVNEKNYMIKYLLLSCLPFNILLSSLVGLITFIIYKKTSIILKKFINE